jgi:heterodisulfide reductase subunit B
MEKNEQVAEMMESSMEITYQDQLARQIQEECGENVNSCYQCKKCTAGCPVTDHVDLTPHRLLRAIQLGQKDTVLNSKAIWLCTACEACSTRCPVGLSIPRVVDALRIMAAREGIKPAVPSMPAFYTSALRGIKLFGRMYEAGLMGELYLRLALSGGLDYEQLLNKDLSVALRMLRTGKLKPLPPLSRAAKHSRKETAEVERQEVGYYPGCSLHGTSIEYDMSIRAIASKIGLELVEPNGWVCCGTTPAHSTDHLLSTIMPMRTLSCVEQSGQSYVTVPCPSCFIRMRTALRDIDSDPELKEQVAAKVKYTPSPELKVDHLLTTIAEQVGVDRVASAVTRPLDGLKVVCYYGCVITRPPELTDAAEYEYPMSMDHLMQAIGAETLDWSYKTECCGVSLMFTQLPIVMDMSHKILDNAREVGAQAIVVACPLCQINLDVRQQQTGQEYGQDYNLPILYFTQLMGLAFGLETAALGVDKHFVSAKSLLQERDLWPE